MARILDAEVSFRSRRLVAPLQLSSGPIEELTEATAWVVVEAGGRRASGRGAVYLSDLWAWPDDSLTHRARDEALRRLCEKIADELPIQFRNENCHPLEHGLRLDDLACHRLSIAPSPPLLARALCSSPFDAAIHDAAGIALGVSAFSLYQENVALPSADAYFPKGGACCAIADVLQSPHFELPAWYIVGKEEPLETTLLPAIRKHGYRCFKLKLSGCDVQQDVSRTVEVCRAALASGVSKPRITVDTNEASQSVAHVVEFLDALQAANTEAYNALEYMEQPTDRDIRTHAFDWRPVAERKPVLIDEGLTDLDVLSEAEGQGYSGLALKTCKGHSMLLVCAAWAHQHGMLISLQDLTNPGIALIHGALVGAHLPTINGAELNSPQFTPDANHDFTSRMPELFEPRDGYHRLPSQLPAGLGSQM